MDKITTVYGFNVIEEIQRGAEVYAIDAKNNSIKCINLLSIEEYANLLKDKTVEFYKHEEVTEEVTEAENE